MGEEQYQEQVQVIALIPAHNEEVLLPATIRSLEAQTHPIETIYVVSDNSTDDTVNIAARWRHNVQIIETVDNTHKKAGALNQALQLLAPQLSDDTWVFIVDADSCPVPHFVERALQAVQQDHAIGAVGGVFLTQDDETVLMRLQNNEYVRYARELSRDKARARVLTGTATLISMQLLRKIEQQRTCGDLPGSGLYNASALVEDFDLSLCCKRLGYRIVSPKECIVYTEAMPTLDRLWQQRIRWQRGALECLYQHGFNRVTLPYIFKQAQMALGILSLLLMATVTVWSLILGVFSFQPLWFDLGVVFLIERMVSVWRAGKGSIRLAAMVVPELCYDLLLSAAQVWAYVLVLARTKATWGIATIDQQ